MARSQSGRQFSAKLRRQLREAMREERRLHALRRTRPLTHDEQCELTIAAGTAQEVSDRLRVYEFTGSDVPR